MFLVLFSVFLLGSISIRIKCDQATKEKVLKEESIASKKDRQVYLTARLQFYTSEDRIVNTAINELNMIKRTEPRIVLDVSREKIERINQILKEKYD